MKLWTCMLITMMLLSACLGSNREKETLKQAVVVHNEMMSDAASLRAWLNSVAGDTTLTIPADSLAVWTATLSTWEHDIVEVPGNEEHHHEEGEHHHHQTVDVTADQMLMIQQDLNKRLSALQQRIKPYYK